MSSLLRKQDLPPKGGYPAFNYKRIPPKSVFSSWGAIAVTVLSWTVGGHFYRKDYKNKMMDEVEQRSVLIALEPLLLAERDRAFLKQLRINRDEENRLMKDVEGWTTGGYYSEPLYKTVPKDTFLPVPFFEYYVHADPREGHERAFEFMNH